MNHPTPSTVVTTTDTVTLRPGKAQDAAACGAICFEAFGAINRAHGFPSDFASPEHVAGMMSFLFSMPQIDSVIAESGGRIVGSNFLWAGSVVGGVGPITVDPGLQGGSIGPRPMERGAGQGGVPEVA